MRCTFRTRVQGLYMREQVVKAVVNVILGVAFLVVVDAEALVLVLFATRRGMGWRGV